jgi:hypothetical protein
MNCKELVLIREIRVSLPVITSRRFGTEASLVIGNMF